MSPSPSSGPPELSASPSPPPFWGMPLLAGGGEALGAVRAGSGAGLGAGFGGAGCDAAEVAACGAARLAGCEDDAGGELDCPAWLPVADTANQLAPNATTPCPFVSPGFSSLMNR